MKCIKYYDAMGVPLKYLHQWDLNQTITISEIDVSLTTEIHFSHPDSNEALVVTPSVSNTSITATIPNILLQQAKSVMVFVFQESNSIGSRTVGLHRITVIPRPKPADYVYEETEALTWHALDERIKALEDGGGGSGGIASESDPTVPSWAKQAEKPSYTAQEVGADASGTAAAVVSGHNTDSAAHNDLRLELQALAKRINAALDSDDSTLDELSEIVAYIKSNKSLIDAITTSKVNVSDIVDDLVTNAANRPLSAAQGVALKALIDAITVPTKVSELENDAEYLTEHQDISGKLDANKLPEAVDNALAQAKESGEFDGSAATIEIVEAESLEPGAAPAVTELEGSTAQARKYRISIPQGAVGATPNLTIGTVSVSTPGVALATITGTAENPVLNLSVPQGEPGKDGNDGRPGADGQPGKDGYTPIKGTDYYTPEDKAEFETYIATELAKRGQLKPEFAGSVEECTDTSKLYVLPDGYIYAYMETAVPGGEPLFTNLVDPTSSDWQADKRFSSSSGSISDCTGAVVSNTITAKKGDIIRVKGLQNGSTSATSAAYLSIMGYTDETGATKAMSVPITLDKTKSQHSGGVKDIVTIEDDAIVYQAFQLVSSSGGTTEHSSSDTIVSIRVSGEPVTTVDDIVVTINEKIAYSAASTGYAWTSTGHAFVPADYEDRISEVENTAAQHATKIAAIEKAVESGGTDETEAAALERIKVWDKPVYDSAPVTLLGDDRVKPALTSEDMTVEAIHAKYRALMAAHPRYIKETYLGPCTSSDTFPAVDMLRFDFCEPDGLTEPTFGPEETHETKPKIIFISGIHKEWAGVYGLYYALEEITTNPAFYDIRRNAHIIVVPCANPFGLTDQTAIEGWQMSHVNANGIAPHNNFGVNHRSLGTVGEYNYGGTTPYSELENQYIDAVMAENSDAIAFITCHNNNYSTYYGSHVIWASSATYHMCNLTFRLVDKMTTAWLDKYGQTLKDAIDQYKFNMDADDYRLGRATMSTSRGTEQQNATKYGILATNLEIPDRMRVFSGETRHTSETMTHGAEVYANFIRIILSAYDANDRKEYAPNLPWSE